MGFLLKFFQYFSSFFQTTPKTESSYRASRPSLTECLNHCVRPRVDGLMVSEISRIWRSLKTLADTLAGVDVYIKNLGIHTLDEEKKKNPFGTLLISVMGACAEIERENIRDRLHSGRELAKARGVRMGRKVGFTLAKRTLSDGNSTF